MKRVMVAFLTALVAVLVAAGTLQGGDGDYIASIEAYRAKRLADLRSDTGWLTVAGFHWLEPGENTFGTGTGNRVELPEGSAPQSAGVLRLTGVGDDEAESAVPRVEVEANPGVELRIDGETVAGPVTIWTEDDGAKKVSVGRVTFWVMPRGEGYAIRVRDLESPLRKNFKGFEFYAIDPAYRVEGRLEPFDEPREIEFPNVMGYTSMEPSPGRIRFELGSESYSLLPMIEDPDKPQELFFVFGDKTNGTETYAGGRFMYADLEPDGTIVLDFNKAYNPPCAYNPFTTCPLPPEGNVLPVPLPVGEKDYKGSAEKHDAR